MCGTTLRAQGTDTTASKPKPKKQEHYGHQLRVNFDISKPLLNALAPDHKSYELYLDYYLKNEVYLVIEGGAGKATIDYPDLNYTSNTTFFKAGVDKCLVTRVSDKDWDVIFIGARYGLGLIQRSDATYTIHDSLWGQVQGATPGKSFTGHWIEITLGLRVELYKGLFAGWNGRAKFLLNESAFLELPPAYIAGYGKGDQTVAFDFNFYLSYAFRWSKKVVKK